MLRLGEDISESLLRLPRTELSDLVEFFVEGGYELAGSWAFI